MKIALDAFGGDNAPQAIIEGAINAVNEEPPPEIDKLNITLVGNRLEIEKHLKEKLPDSINVLDIPLKTDSNDQDPHADGDDKDSAIRTALRLHKAGKFDAVVSAGNTGAQVIASLMELEKIPGITRPAVGSFLPTAGGQCFLLDVGASLVASPHHLVQFATMGHVYVHQMLGINEPRIGVLNTGKEDSIGERNAVEAHALLAESGFNFTGFVEGRDLPLGVADVVVTNGFVGNVLLKFMEGFPALLRKLSSTESIDSLKSILKELDYQQFGGEPLLGVRGISIICHGSSSAQSITASILRAARMSKLKIYEKLDTFLAHKFDSYFSRVKYLRSFRRTFRLPGRFARGDSTKT
ncbi:phosphate acyltransferase PlsX [bacterium]|nr:phosphate acyltransferase PlsX [bacterium]